MRRKWPHNINSRVVGLSLCGARYMQRQECTRANLLYITSSNNSKRKATHGWWHIPDAHNICFQYRKNIISAYFWKKAINFKCMNYDTITGLWCLLIVLKQKHMVTKRKNNFKKKIISARTITVSVMFIEEREILAKTHYCAKCHPLPPSTQNAS